MILYVYFYNYVLSCNSNRDELNSYQTAATKTNYIYHADVSTRFAFEPAEKNTGKSTTRKSTAKTNTANRRSWLLIYTVFS